MIKRSPSRNHRSKGIKVKHVLQIILLVGVCFWLIYQVKHSHDKKKEFDEKDAKMSIATQTAYKPGRKDLHPGKDEVTQTEKPEEEEEDDSIIEDEDKHEHNEHEEEGNLHETEDNEEKEDNKRGVKEGEEEQEEDENKSNENENERGAGDDEIDEDDQDKSAADTDRDEEFEDEEKEKEMEDVSNEKENENNKDEEKEGSVENQNSHEAREEHYKGDDASSAVTHDTHTTNTETETVSLESSDVNSEMSIMKSENKPNYTEEINSSLPSSDIKITEVVPTVGTPSNATSGEETGNSSSSNTTDRSHLNNTTMTYPGSHSKAGNNLTVVIPGGSNITTGTGADTSSEQNKMVSFSESIQAQNDTANATVTGDVKNIPTGGQLEQSGDRTSEENLPDSNSTVSVKTENSDAGGGQSSDQEGSELDKMKRSIASNETEGNGNTETSETDKTQNILNSKESTDATKDEELKGDRQTGETSDSDSSVANRTSDSDMLNDVAKVRTDLDTLPRIRNEGDNVNGATATN